tara:strand:+ start:659 stop:925 length:267 start_codon:yes stop_codon:yes gene_type:complete
MEHLGTSITVSFLAMGVIFTTLTVLIGVIKMLVSWMPYAAPPPSLKKRKNTSHDESETTKHIAIIHATIAHHIGKQPEEIEVSDIRPL